MKLSLVLISLSLLISTSCRSQSNSNSETSKPHDPFTHCDFVATPSGNHHLFAGKIFRPSCEIEINTTDVKKYIYGRGIGLIIVRPKDANNEARSAGFVETSPGQWKVIGRAYGISPIHWVKLDMATHKHGDDITLVAWQTESSMIAQGGPVTINSISIFRQTPTFSISTGMAFEPMKNSSLRTVIENELVKIVESVKVSSTTTGTRPPTH